MSRDTKDEKFAFEERLAICLANNVPEAEAYRIADKQLWDMIRKSERELREKNGAGG